MRSVIRFFSILQFHAGSQSNSRFITDEIFHVFYLNDDRVKLAFFFGLFVSQVQSVCAPLYGRPNPFSEFISPTG